MFYSDEVIEEVRSRNDIVDVISDYVKLQKKGSSYFGLCPFHNEKSPSFSVSPGKQMYYCFGCGAGGNVFTFLMEYENDTFPEAVKRLAQRAGMALENVEETQEDRKRRDLKTSVLEVQKIAAKYYYYLLHTDQGANAMAYLKNRQLTEDTIRRFGLGYAGQYSNALSSYLKKKGISDAVLKESGLLLYSEKYGMSDKFWNRVMFPIMDVNQRVIGFGGRVMGDGKPKYLNSPETILFDKSRNLYGLHAAKNARKKNIILCEGYMDVIALHQAGFTNAVASLGTAFTASHALILKRYTSEVVLTYDSDEAGIRAALRAIPILKKAGITAKVLNMKPYKDPDEFIKAMGAEAFSKRIEEAKNSFLFELSALEQTFQLSDPESKTRFFQEAAARIAAFEQELERENYIEAVAVQYSVSFEGLRKMVQMHLMAGVQKTRQPVRQSRSIEKEDGLLKSQRLLLTWLIEYPSLFPVLSQYIEPEDFTDELYCKVAGSLFEQLKKGELNPVKIMDQFTDSDRQRQIAQIFNTEIKTETKEATEKAICESIHKVMEAAIEKKSQKLDPADIGSLQSLVFAKRRLQDLSKMHISI